MSALWISHVTVTDEVEYAKYAKLATLAFAEHGGFFWHAAARMFKRRA